MSKSLEKRIKRLEELQALKDEPMQQKYLVWFSHNKFYGLRRFRMAGHLCKKYGDYEDLTLFDVCEMLESGEFTMGRQMGNKTAMSHLSVMLSDDVIDKAFFDKCAELYS